MPAVAGELEKKKEKMAKYLDLAGVDLALEEASHTAEDFLGVDHLGREWRTQRNKSQSAEATAATNIGGVQVHMRIARYHGEGLPTMSLHTIER